MVAYLLLYKIAQLFVVMMLGFLLVKLGLVKSRDSTVLSRISLYLLMPCAIIESFSVELTGDVLSGLLFAFVAAVAVHLLLFGVDFVYARLTGVSKLERASVFYSNSGNLIIPIVTFCLGGEYVIYATAFLVVQLILIWTHGVCFFVGKEGRSLKKILLNVNLLAIVLGAILLAFRVRVPNFIGEITSSLGSMVGYVGMLIAGMTAASVDLAKTLRRRGLYAVCLMRTVVVPALALALLLAILAVSRVAGEEKILLITFLATMTPTAATILQFAQIHDTEPDYAVAINVASTLLAILTMPLFVLLYETLAM